MACRCTVHKPRILYNQVYNGTANIVVVFTLEDYNLNLIMTSLLTYHVPVACYWLVVFSNQANIGDGPYSNILATYWQLEIVQEVFDWFIEKQTDKSDNKKFITAVYYHFQAHVSHIRCRCCRKRRERKRKRNPHLSESEFWLQKVFQLIVFTWNYHLNTV